MVPRVRESRSGEIELNPPPFCSSFLVPALLGSISVSSNHFHSQYIALSILTAINKYVGASTTAMGRRPDLSSYRQTKGFEHS